MIMRAIAMVVPLWLLSGCFSYGVHKWRRAGLIPKSDTITIDLPALKELKAKILYTGCGGLVISSGNEALMTDPYYTGHHILNVFWKKIDPKNDERVLKRTGTIIDPKKINAVFVAHSHYDHIEDLPYLLKNKKLGDSVSVYGDSSTHCTINKFLQAGQTFVNADGWAYSHSGQQNSYKWINVAPHIKVLPIESSHAPHWYKLRFMRGSTCKNGIPHFSEPHNRSNGFRWKEGKVYSFLVDFTDDAGNIQLRIFLQSSSCLPPKGFPPPEELRRKKVDVAFLGMASANYVKPYPRDLIKTLDPDKIVLIHWEDFFRDMYNKNLRSVKLTNPYRFFRRLRRCYNYRKTSQLREKIVMPAPLSIINIE